MPRKSNKTAHVLGLITNEKQDAPRDFDDEAPEASEESPKHVRKAIVRKQAPAILDNQGDSNNKLSEEIRNSLLEDLDGPSSVPLENVSRKANFHPYAPNANTPKADLEGFSNEESSDAEFSDQAFSNEESSDEAFSNEESSDEAFSDEAFSDAEFSDEELLAKEFSKNKLADNSGFNNNVQNNENPENNLTQNTSFVDNVTQKPPVQPVVADYPLEDFGAEAPVAEIVPEPSVVPSPVQNVAPSPVAYVAPSTAAMPNLAPMPSAAPMPSPMHNTMPAPATPTLRTAPVNSLPPTPNTPAAEASASHSPYIPPHHATYVYINVLEELVKERTLLHMKDFDVCLCNRCVMDTMALALTSLPSKYIVVEKGEGIPLLNYYGSKFQIQVVSELTKACMIIKEFPHH